MTDETSTRTPASAPGPEPRPGGATAAGPRTEGRGHHGHDHGHPGHHDPHGGFAQKRERMATLRERIAAGVPDDNRPAMVQVSEVHRHYGPVRALDGVSLDIPEGDFVVLLGPSGSGKTTLLRAIAGIETIDSGSVAIGGRTVSGRGTNVAPDKRGLGMVFQDYALWPHMTVAQNVGYALRQQRAAREEVRRRSNEMLERVGLEGLSERYPTELSGGQQQRVALARALVAQPRLVLFDEPLSNLDADLRERLRVEISTLTRDQGATAVYITHDQREAFALADRIGVLDHGRLVQFGTPEQIYHDPASAFVANFTGVSGTLTGTVLALLPNGDCEVKLPQSRLWVRAAPGCVEGGDVEVHVRPTATTVKDSSFSGPEHKPNRLSGEVVDIAYRGASYDHVVRGPWGTLTGVPNPTPLRREWPCVVRVDPDQAMAFPV